MWFDAGKCAALRPLLRASIADRMEPDRVDRRWVWIALAILACLVAYRVLQRTAPTATKGPTFEEKANALVPTGGAPSTPAKIASTTNTAAPPASAPQTVAVAMAWGTGKGELGKIERKEGNAEAPMSLVVGKDGTTWVLDQVNNRIVRFDKSGAPLEPIPLSLKAPQELAIGKDGTVAVLDRLVDKQVVILGPDGKPRGTLTLEGKGIDEGGGVSGLFIDGDKVYVEREHETVLRLGDTSGKPDPKRDEVPGRPTRDGSAWIRAWMGEIPGQKVFVASRARDTEENRFTRQINATMSLSAILLLDSDLAGVIYLGALGSAVDDKGTTVGEPQIVLYCLEPLHGAVIGSTSVPASLDPHETFRELAVADEGGVLYLQRDTKGAKLVRLDCRPHG